MLSFKEVFSNDNKLRLHRDDISKNEQNLSDNKVKLMFENVLDDALKNDCTDIHIEPRKSKGVIRFRIKGDLNNYLEIEENIFINLISYIKVCSNLNISEKRIPQDGRMTKRTIDIRTSTIPTIFGEKIVLRLLNRSNFLKSKRELGFLDEHISIVEEIINKKQGLFLITGKTGSGKTTTAYSLIKDLINSNINIMTIEDPIEYNLEEINQTQVNKKAGFNFDNGVKAILRQDPDVILIGEIRDVETAKIAIKASMTGHLVISTMHSNDSVSSIIRLLEMEIKSNLINTSLVGVINQKIINSKLEYEILKVSEELTNYINSEVEYKILKDKAVEFDLIKYNKKELCLC
ncbi:MAG: GspE/PulE family protein [Peptostreptococcaceae bacterium]